MAGRGKRLRLKENQMSLGKRIQSNLLLFGAEGGGKGCYVYAGCKC
jgi:hypothetical protein